MLAEIETVSLREFGIFMFCLIIVSGVYLRWQGNQIAQRLANKPHSTTPQPLVVKPADNFATKAELDRVEREFKKYMEQERLEAGNRRQLIYAKIDSSNKDLTGKMDDNRVELEEKIAAVHERVDTIPDRIFAMLNNMKH